MRNHLIFILYTLLFHTGCEEADCHRLLPFAMKYVKTRNISSVNVFMCYNGESTKALRTGKWNAILTNSKLSDSVTGEHISELLRAQHYLTGVVIDLNCQSSFNLINVMSHHRLFNTSFAVMLLSDDTLEAVMRVLEESGIAFDSDVTLFVDDKLYDLHRTAILTPLISSEIGWWKSEGNMEVSSRPMRWDVKGALLTAVTVIKSFKKDLIGKEEFFDGRYLVSIDPLSRFAWSMHRYIEYLNNFTTEISISPDWGYYNRKTGMFDPDSMYGLLERGLFDFGLSFSWLFEERVKVIHFSPAVNLLKSCVAFRHPPSGASIQALALPFSTTTWLVILTAVLISTLCLCVIRRWRNDNPPAETDFNSSLLQITAVLCLQGSYIESARIPTRILSLFIQVMALMIYTYYDAKIIGFLLLPNPRTITSIEKLLESNMDLWVENISFHKHHFEADYLIEAVKYYEEGIKGRLNGKDKIIDRIEGLMMVEKGGTALYGTTPALFDNIQKMYTSSEICSLHYLDTVIMQTAAPVKKLSPYREMYDKGFMRLVESGLRSYEDRKWHAEKPECVGTEANAAVELEATFVAQAVYSSGFILALFFFICENLMAPTKKSVRTQQSPDIPWLN